MRVFVFFISLFFAFSLNAQVIIDLKKPIFKDGVLSTTEGGVLKSDDMRIQAKEIHYDQKNERVKAKGDIIVNKERYVIVGESLTYDFVKNEGEVLNGRLAFRGWFVGGDKIEMKMDDSYEVHNGYMTTSPNIKKSWSIEAKKIKISKDKDLKASSTSIKINGVPIFIIPTFHTNLEKSKRLPISLDFHTGGFRGSRLGIKYRFLEFSDFNSSLLLNYRIGKGFGGGFDLEYKDLFAMKNYMVEDSSIRKKNKHLRYRFLGKYSQNFNDSHTSILAEYDKLSDYEMASNMYMKNDFDLKEPNSTRFRIGHYENWWRFSLLTDVRLNKYETVNQHLPEASLSSKPFAIGKTGIILDNRAKISSLNYVYDNYSINPEDFNSTRFAFQNETYRPFKIGSLNLIPSVGASGVYYGNNMNQSSIGLLQAKAGVDVRTSLSKIYGNKKHVMEPYISYKYLSKPTKSVNNHYIFDIEDGITELNFSRIGLKNSIYRKKESAVKEILRADLYLLSFYNSKNSTFSKIGATVNWLITDRFLIGVDALWNFKHKEIDRVNLRADYTHNENIAFGIEFRHRGPFDWRKSDRGNFAIDYFLPESNLLKSKMSDKRDTIIARAFLRLGPDWSCKIESRNGWNRKDEPKYNEIKADLIKKLQGKWQLGFSFQHTEEENAFSINLKLAEKWPF